MNELLLDYLPLAVFIAVTMGIALVLLVTPIVISYPQLDAQKIPPDQ